MTERARSVITAAAEEATRMRHDYVSTEHVLLAILREGECVAAMVLRDLGVELNEVQREVEKHFPPGSVLVGSSKSSKTLPHTPRMKKMLASAKDEAETATVEEVGTEHLLIAILRDGESMAGKLLGKMGVTADDVQDQVLKLLPGENPEVKQVDTEPPPARGAQTRWIPRPQSNPPREPEAPTVVPAISRTIFDAITAACDLAAGLGHKAAGTGHFLLALIQQEDGLIGPFLRKQGVDIDRAWEGLTSEIDPETGELKREVPKADSVPPITNPSFEDELD